MMLNMPNTISLLFTIAFRATILIFILYLVCYAISLLLIFWAVISTDYWQQQLTNHLVRNRLFDFRNTWETPGQGYWITKVVLSMILSLDVNEKYFSARFTLINWNNITSPRPWLAILLVHLVGVSVLSLYCSVLLVCQRINHFNCLYEQECWSTASAVAVRSTIWKSCTA